MNRHDGPAPLGDALGGYLARHKLSERLEKARIVTEWDDLVGRQIAEVTRPIGITSDGMLYVAVSSAAWMQELQLMSPTILRQLAMKGHKIERIIWRSG